MTRLLFILFFTLPLFTACHNKTSQASGDNGAFAKAKSHSDGVNIDRISQSGELIIGTISGPDTYFDYQGRGMGLQYALAEDFANTLGVGVRVELATDSTELAKMLKKGDVDVIAYQLSPSFCQKQGIATAGAKNTKTGASWAILPDAKDLAEALNDWYGDGVEVKAQKTERTWLHNRTMYTARYVPHSFHARKVLYPPTTPISRQLRAIQAGTGDSLQHNVIKSLASTPMPHHGLAPVA